MRLVGCSHVVCLSLSFCCVPPPPICDIFLSLLPSCEQDNKTLRIYSIPGIDCWSNNTSKYLCTGNIYGRHQYLEHKFPGHQSPVHQSPVLLLCSLLLYRNIMTPKTPVLRTMIYMYISYLVHRCCSSLSYHIILVCTTDGCLSLSLCPSAGFISRPIVFCGMYVRIIAWYTGTRICIIYRRDDHVI